MPAQVSAPFHWIASLTIEVIITDSDTWMPVTNRNNGIDRKLLARYVAGECSASEKAQVRAWIAVDDRAGRLLDELEVVWKVTAEQENPVDDLDALKRLNERIRQHAETPREQRLRPVGRPPVARSRRLIYQAARVAAVVVLAVALAFLFVRPRAEAPAEGKVFATGRGQRATIRLADGTSIQLNVESRITLAPDFGESERALTLEGEAFFEVSPDSSRPFLVHGGDALVKVLGTSFDVAAFPDDQITRVVVKEGAVSVSTPRSMRRDTVILRPRDAVIFQGKDAPLIHRGVDLDNYLAWTEGRLVFEHASFNEVATQLERWYDLDVHLTIPSNEVDRLNAVFTNEQMSEILNAIALALDLQYERDSRRVVFSPHERAERSAKP